MATNTKTATGRAKRGKRTAAHDHFKVICVSLYNEDLARLDDVVASLKARGFTKASRSAVLRVAMNHLRAAPGLSSDDVAELGGRREVQS